MGFLHEAQDGDPLLTQGVLLPTLQAQDGIAPDPSRCVLHTLQARVALYAQAPDTRWASF